MNGKNILITASLLLTLSSGFLACKSQEDKDKEIKAKVEAAAPGVQVTVDKGVVTLNGEVASEADVKRLEEAAGKVDGVKSVSSKLSVPPPPVINPDQGLTDALAGITAEFPKVQAVVADGVVTLNGEISKADLPKLMQKVQESRPKEVKNNLVVK